MQHYLCCTPIFYILLIILVTGIFGGIVSFFMNVDEDSTTETEAYRKSWYFKLIRSVIVGMGGAIAVPVFLYLIDSQLVKGKDSFTDPMQYLYFAGFCLIGSVFAKKFLTTVSDSVLKLAKEAKQKADANEQKINDIDKNVDEKVKETEKKVNEKIENQVAQIDIGSSSKTADSNQFRVMRFIEDSDKRAPEKEENKIPVVAGDQQKNQWGGLAERNDRDLTATVEDDDGYYYRIVLQVKSLKPVESPLQGVVIFHLHESFKNDVRIVKVTGGIAKLTLYAYGAFTVGAQCDAGKTSLELDLSELEEAPKKFRER